MSFKPIRSFQYWRHTFRAARSLGKADYRQLELEAREMLAAKPNETLAKNMLALALYHTGRPHEAADTWEQVLETNPVDSNALEHLVEYHENEGNIEVACKLVRRALAVDTSELHVTRWSRRLVLIVGRLMGDKNAGETLDSGLRKHAKHVKEWRAWAEKFVAARCPERQRDEFVN